MLRTILTMLTAALIAAAGSLASPPVVGELTAGLGCGAQCITKAWVTPAMTGATVEVKTDTPAVYTVKVSDQAPGYIDGKPWIPNPDASANTWLPALTFTFSLDGLAAGTRYHILVTATDTEGRTAHRLGTFETLDPPPLPPAAHHAPVALVTFWAIRVEKDGDRVGKGELEFDFRINGLDVHNWGRKKVKSPTTIHPHAPEWPIPIEPAPDQLEILVRARECDNAVKKNCAWEAEGPGGVSCAEVSQWDVACAEGLIDIAAAAGALPPNYGTDMPPGHDVYFVLRSEADEKLEFVVYGFVDVVGGE